MLASIEYIKTLLNGLKQWVEGRVKFVRKELTDKIEELPQADWNQNDPEAKDYVKNRSHWTEAFETIVFSDESFSVTESLGERIFEVALDTQSDNVYYKLVWDGKEYDVHFNMEHYYGYPRFWMGNGALVGPYNNFAPPTDDPFLLTPTHIVSDQVGVHSVKVVERIEDIHGLDPKYLVDVESALSENSREILKIDHSKFLTEDTPMSVIKCGTTVTTKTRNYSGDRHYISTFNPPDYNKILVIFSRSEKTYYDDTQSMNLSFYNNNGNKITKSPQKLDGRLATKDDLPLSVTVLAINDLTSNLYLLNPRTFSGSYNDLTDKPSLGIPMQNTSNNAQGNFVIVAEVDSDGHATKIMDSGVSADFINWSDQLNSHYLTNRIYAIDENGIESKLVTESVIASGPIINSSTPNSTKRFKIAVDDSGTISATEVTN